MIGSVYMYKIVPEVQGTRGIADLYLSSFMLLSKCHERRDKSQLFWGASCLADSFWKQFNWHREGSKTSTSTKCFHLTRFRFSARFLRCSKAKTLEHRYQRISMTNHISPPSPLHPHPTLQVFSSNLQDRHVHGSAEKCPSVVEEMTGSNLRRANA